MGFYYFDYRAFMWMLPAILFSAFAQFKVQATFSRYSKVRCLRGCTGAAAAQAVAAHGGVLNISVRPISGNLTDNYDPRTNVISLSQGVYGSSSVSAVGVAAHEAGHSIQTAQGYLPNKIRTSLRSFPFRLFWWGCCCQRSTIWLWILASHCLALRYCSSWLHCRSNLMQAPVRFRHWMRRNC